MVAPVLTVSSSGWAWTNMMPFTRVTVCLARPPPQPGAPDPARTPTGAPCSSLPPKASRESSPPGTMATVEARQVRVAADGGRVVYRRGDALWVYEPGGTAREVTRLGQDVSGYATDARASFAVFSRQGRLYRADLDSGAVTEVPTVGPAHDARPDPTGQRIGYLTGGALHVVDAAGTDT